MNYSWETYLKPFKGKFYNGEWPTLTEIFLITHSQYPDKYCFTKFSPTRVSYTYAEVYQKLLTISSYLKEKGLKKGDKVAINGKNSIEWALAYMAANFCGAVVVPLDNQLHVGKLKQLITYSDSSFIIADKNVLENIEKEDASYLNDFKECLTLQGKSSKYKSIMDVEATKILPPTKGNCEDIAAIIFTSGTTGNEKGAVLTQKNISSDIFQASDDTLLNINSTDILYALLPLHHSYCCTAVLLVSLAFGCECIFGHGIVLSRMLNDLKRGKVTIFMGIPLLYNKLLSGIMKEIKKKGILVNSFVHLLMFINGIFKKQFNKAPFRKFFDKMILSKLGFDHNKFLISGAGPLAPKVFKQYQQLGLDFVQGYGLTETSPIVALNPKDHFKIDSVGRMFALVDVKILNPDKNGIGEIALKGPNICKGYYKDQENTEKLFEDGWLKTGDLGYLDKENYLYLKGRAKNIIVTEGGKNIYPEEIEDMFQTYSQIEQILIRGYQEKKDVPAECIEALIYPSEEFFKDKKDSIESEINEIINSVNKELSGYKKISKITLIDKPMEMTSTKKIKRNLVK